VGSNASTLPGPTVCTLPPPRSGLFGTQRNFTSPRNHEEHSGRESLHEIASRETIPVEALQENNGIPHSSPLRNDPFLYNREYAHPASSPPTDFGQSQAFTGGYSTPAVDLGNDPFLTHVPTEYVLREPNEKTPLAPRADDSKKFRSRIGNQIIKDDAKMWMVPTGAIMVVQTLVSGVVLALAFGEFGHRSGYDEGHLDPEDQHAGCEPLFIWLLVQAGIDLCITLVTCMMILSPLNSDPVSFHGCIASLRLCTLSAGFHILYFSGLKRDLCDSALIAWSTIITWLGIAVVGVVSCYLLQLLLTNSGKTKRQILGNTQVKSSRPSLSPGRPGPTTTYSSSYNPQMSGQRNW
jgi:hypothetical protein